MVRVKKSLKNSIIGSLMYVATFFPLFIVRKVFLDTLGNELLGLSSLYNNIIGYLSIVEMGIGTAIIFSLYKPFAENDSFKIKGYLDYYKKFYRIAGITILILGLLITKFLHIFIKDDINMLEAKLCFLLFLINVFISYLFSYKHCLLTVAQDGYILSIVTTLSKIVIAIFQVIVIIKYNTFYSYIIVQILINLIFYITLNIFIDKKFKNIKSVKGKLFIKEKKDLFRNIKALFFHKLGSVFVLGTDNLVLSTFVSLKAVTKYNNYYMVISALSGIISTGITAITPSIGNLLAGKNKDKAFDIHKKLFFSNFWISSFIIISLYNTSTQFIMLWLDENQILDKPTISLILFNSYFLLMRNPVEKFKEAGGKYYKDRFAPLIEGIINLVSSIVLVNLIGLPGVFIGTLTSNLTVLLWVQPKIVYKYIFNKPLSGYFKLYLKYLLIGLIPLFVTSFLTDNIRKIADIKLFLLNCTINLLVINGLYLIIFWKNQEFNYFKNLILDVIKKKNHRK